jgi:hypothetical protein
VNRGIAKPDCKNNVPQNNVSLDNAPTTLAEAIMNNAAQRSIFRWIHIVFSIPILGYIYSPFEKLPDYAPPTRYVFLPVMILSGLWMWKGYVVR